MNRLIVNSFSLLAFFSFVISSRVPVVADDGNSNATRLRPIHIVDYEAAIGLHRRASESFSDLDLQTQSHLIYGSSGDNGQLLFANMTLYAPDGLLMIMMERFEGLTSSVDCKGDDGLMSLTFQSENAFKYALQEWNFINQNDEGKFLLIANHEGCGPGDQRQPYLISKITEDPAKLTTLLTARTAPWSDVAGTYDLDFGQAMPYQKPPQLKQRGLWGDIMNVGKDVLNAAEGNADLSKSVTFDVSVGHQGQRTNIYTNDKGRLTLDCINCFVAGSFEVTGHLSVDHFNLQDLQLTASPNNFQAELELEATITSSDNPDSLQYTKELFSFPIPDAGIEVEGIFKLGAALSYDVGVSSSFSGSATVDFGIQAGIPNSAQLIVDVQNPDQSSANGFGTSDLTPVFDIKKESASVTLAAFSQPKLAFGVELSEVGNIDVAITIKIPEISVTLSAEYDEAGACSQTPGSSQTGVKLDSEVDVEVDLQIDASLGDDEDTAKPSWSKKLWGVSEPLGSMCFPLEIPGLEGTVNATSKTAPPPTSSSMIASSVTSASYPLSQSSNPVSVTGSHSPPASTSSSVSLWDLASISFMTSASATSGPGSSSTVTDLLPTLASSPSKSVPSSSGPASITLAPTSSSSLGSSSAALATSSSISQDAVGGKKAVVVHSKSTFTSHVSSKSLPSTTTSKLTSSTKVSAAETVDVPPKPKHTTSAPEVEEAPILTTEKPSPTSSSKMSSAVTEITSSAESGGGGCRMVKRFGKRMLIC